MSLSDKIRVMGLNKGVSANGFIAEDVREAVKELKSRFVVYEEIDTEFIHKQIDEIFGKELI